MLDEMERKFEVREILLIGFGNPSNNMTTQMKGYRPSSNKEIFKLLSKWFDVVEIDAFKTSNIYHKNLKTELVHVRVKKRKRKKPIHE